jgi:ornithine decarboxylase
MGLDNLTDKDPGLLITQSTHKQLAGISQASQIHVKDSHIKGQKRRVNHKRLNEVYMMHMSTSPFYPMFASLDVGAQMMKGRNGQFLWDDAIKTGIEIRKKIRSLAKEYTEREENPATHWFFDPFVPDVLDVTGSEHIEDLQNIRWEDIPTDVIAGEQQCWLFREDWGIPGPVVAAYLRAKGIVPEKADFNSILFLITPAVEKSKAGTLLAALVEFKNLYDSNADLVDFFPDLVEEFPDFYKGKKIQELCREIHGSLKKYDARLLQKQQFQMEHFPEMAMTPQEAHNAFVANEVDYVPLDEIKGRIAATLALVYPPGIGVIMPGERYDDRAQPMINYFKMFEITNNMFPGFENEIQGMYFEKHVDGTMKYFTYVVKE